MAKDFVRAIKGLIEKINKKKESKGEKPVHLSSFGWNKVRELEKLLNEREEGKKIDVDKAIDEFTNSVDREIAREIDRHVIEEIKRELR